MEAIIELAERNEPVDMLTVTNQLKSTGELEMVGGPYYLTMLTARGLSAGRMEYHIRILHEFWIKRETIRISSEATRKAFEDVNDCFDIVDDMIDEVDEMYERVLVQGSTKITKTKDITLAKINAAISTGGHNYYDVGLPRFDNIVKLSGNNVILVAAKNGSGKTKLIIYLMMMLFRNYGDKIAAKWYSMEDGDDKIMRNMIANNIRLTDDEQMSKGHKLTADQLQLIASSANDISKYDIEFVNKQSSIRDIGKDFKKFRAKRKEKDLNFLIIDNLMLLEDNGAHRTQTEDDVAICKVIDSWNIKTDRRGDPVVILIHHFNDEQIKSINLKNAYRPTEGHVKGNARYRDIATMIWLLNRPGQYADLISEYPGKEDVLKQIFLLDVVKNRNSKTGFLRFFIDLGYNIIEEF